jgi:hypothetical protein
MGAMRGHNCLILLVILLLNPLLVIGASITINLADGVRVKSATAIAAGKTSESSGRIDGSTVTFADVLPQTTYDVKLTLADGTILQGVDLNWYDMEPAKPDAGDLDDDDKQQITAILTQVTSFYNKNEMLFLQGNHDRAVGLVQLVRDKAFHSDTGDEVIWHIELWYFKNQHGGWEKVQQENKILRRERFTTHEAYQDVIDHLRWMPELGGLTVVKDQSKLTITLQPDAAHTSSTEPAK